MILPTRRKRYIRESIFHSLSLTGDATLSTFLAMRKAFIAILVAMVLGASGCQTEQVVLPQPIKNEMFNPTAMRIHPIFTQVKDWTGDGRPDGIEALIEFQDQFGDPTKAAGEVVFELYDYRSESPDPRGNRVVNPWVGSLQTLADQREHWNRTSRTYTFQLAYNQINPGQTYVLTAVFELNGGGRFFDRVILVPQAKESANQPASRNTGK